MSDFILDSNRVYHSLSLSGLAWLEHGFGTAESVAWPPPEPVATMLRQTHSNRVMIVDAETGYAGEGDALVSSRPGTRLAIRTADCVPILLADPQGRVVAAVHAGWRGTAARIVLNAIGLLRERFDTDPAALIAALGPAIGPCCFEVGPEVAHQFEDVFPERNDLDRRTQLDLWEANRRQLLGAGIPGSRISSAELCTCCGGDLFHSYRRSREASGRMVAMIGIR